ncbi:hypothetical protein RF55_9227, partial [Lasius niger]|jgi:hypothetical protein
MGLLS